MKHLNNGQTGRSLIEFDSVRGLFTLRVFALKENLAYTVKNPILEIYYRTDENNAWKNDKSSLTGELTIENQLAKLLNIDLSTNPNGVKEKYKTLYYFKPYENNVYTNRFDFYEAGEGTPALTEGEAFETSTLKRISTEYAELKFDYPSTGAFFEVENKVSKLPYIIVTTVLLCLGIFSFIKCKKII